MTRTEKTPTGTWLLSLKFCAILVRINLKRLNLQVRLLVSFLFSDGFPGSLKHLIRQTSQARCELIRDRMLIILLCYYPLRSHFLSSCHFLDPSYNLRSCCHYYYDSLYLLFFIIIIPEMFLLSLVPLSQERAIQFFHIISRGEPMLKF